MRTVILVLRDAPRTPIRNGIPAFGTYAGRCETTDLALRERGVSRIREYVSEKRWQWFAAFDNQVAVGGALVDAGFFGTAFLWVFDRDAGDMLVDADVVVPSPLLSVTNRPTTSLIARISLPGYRLQMTGKNGQFLVEGRFAGVDLTLEFAVDDRRAITAVCPVPERAGGVNVTQKEPGIEVSGTITAGDDAERVNSLDGVGFLDYSHGLLGRETVWEWAFASGTAADGTPVAFNLVDGFNDGKENAVWIGEDVFPVDEATISCGTHGDIWEITTACGQVAAELTVEGSRRKDVDVTLVRSCYQQPLGCWRGTVAGRDASGVGVAEKHVTRW